MMPENGNLEKKKALEKRTRVFGVAVLRMIDSLKLSTSTIVIGRQLAKSATSIGANYREANRAESYDDFIHKIGIVLKETSETNYWLETLRDLYGENDVIDNLLMEAGALLKIFQSANRTMKINRASKVNGLMQDNQ